MPVVGANSLPGEAPKTRVSPVFEGSVSILTITIWGAILSYFSASAIP